MAKPNSADALNNLGVALAAQRKYDEAVESYRQSLALTPDSALALNNLGNSLRALGQVEEAVRSLRQAIRLKPDYAEAYNNLGITLVQRGQDDEAIANYERALYFRPDYPEAHLNRSLAWLARGDFKRGWTEYEWRWKAKDVNCRTFRQRRWDGSTLQGRSIFIYLEQGVGDTLQFIRYARLLKQRGATVIVEAQKSLMKLLAGCPAIDRLVETGGSLPEFDLQVPLLSLPGILGTTAEDVPAEVPYLFADPGLVEHWKTRLCAIEGFKIGIAWQGNPQYRGDRQRSVPLRCFAPLARVAGVRLISLQKGTGSEQIEQLNGEFAVIDLGPLDEEAGAFMDTAAIMRNLDLVITSDTAMPHLAGALAAPVWMALPFIADWRWMRDGEQCPWYPTMRMFRQAAPNNWEGLFERMAEALSQHVSRSQAAAQTVERRSINSALAGLERPSSAEERSDQDAEADHRAALEFVKQGKLDEAQQRFERAIRNKPDFVSAHHNLGVILARQHRLDHAVKCFLKTLELDGVFLDAYGNLGLAYYEQGRFHEAVVEFRKALRLGPGSAETFNNLGVALLQLGKPSEAVDYYRQSLRLRPEYVEAHVNLARALLTLGDFEEGWLEHEWREKLPVAAKSPSRKPRWNGAPLAGRSVLLYGEQGLGDTLQFVRYAALAKRGGGRVVVQCQPPLARLLKQCPAVDVVAAGGPTPDHDVQASLLTLPALLRTALCNVPAEIPYLFAERELVDAWKPRLAQIAGFKVGIAWQGNAGWPGDRFRSIPLDQFRPLAELPGVRLINLQKGFGAEQLASVGNRFEVIDFGLALDTRSGPFMDTAAILQALDLVVTSDTSIAHLAGAMGVPVWVALPYAPDWRWMTGRDDSPWYPTMRLFRQPRPGDWPTVFRTIGRTIQERFLPMDLLGVSERPSMIAGRPRERRGEPRASAANGRAKSHAGTHLNLTSPINRLGYGVVGVNLLKALTRVGVSVTYWPIGRIDADDADQTLIQRALENQGMFDGHAPSVRISHQDHLAQHVGFPRIGFPIFELNRFTEKELNHLRQQDMLFVTSRWAKEVVESNQVFKRRDVVHVVPLGVHRDIFHELSDECASRNGQPPPTVFLSIGKWEKRKGHDVLIDAFCKAFRPEDAVELWMLCYNTVIASDSSEIAGKNRQWEDRYKNSPMGDKIKILPRMANQREVAATMRQADCGVFLSRAEGWNLPALELLSCGRQIIITNYSAHTEYCDRSNALLVDIDALEDAHDDRWFFGQGQWASLGAPQIEQTIMHLRQIHQAKQETGFSFLNRAGIETAKRLSWDHSAAKMLDVAG